MEYKRCLLGVPNGSTQGNIEQMRSLIENAVTSIEVFSVATDIGTYEQELFSGLYDLTVCIDWIGFGNEYSKVVREYGYYRICCVAIIPPQSKGDSYLTSYVNAGLTRIIFLNDVNVARMRDCIYREHTKDDVLGYLGIDFRPVRVEREVKEEKTTSNVPTGGTVVERKYLGKGIAVTRLCAQDAPAILTNKTHQYDDILSSLLEDDDLEDDLDAAIDNAVMPYKEFPVDEPWVEEYKIRLSSYFSRGGGLRYFQSFDKGTISKADFEGKVLEQLKEMKIEGDAAQTICDSFFRDLVSYGRIDSLITAEDVSDVRLMSKDVINVQHRGVWYRTNISFNTDDEYRYFIGRICQVNEASINLQDPETIFSDNESYGNLNLRITVTHGLLSSNDNYGSHIRIATKSKRTAERLISDGFFTREQARILIKAIQNKKSIVICGGSGSGKTILLNMLIEHFDPSICGTCIQETDELHSETHPNIEFLHSLSQKGESKRGYTLQQLATTSLLKNAELFIIGEIKGAEASEFMRASRTSRVYATTHAEDFTGAIPRLVELSKETADYSQEEIMKILSKSIHYVVYCEKYRCKQIAKVVGYDSIRKDIIYDLYDFNAKEE